MTLYRYRAILDTCDIVLTEVKQEVWPEIEAPVHSIFDKRNLCKHYPLTVTGTIQHTSKRIKKIVYHRTPAPTEPCSICKGEGQLCIQINLEMVGFIPCKRCNGTGEQFKFLEPPMPKPKKPKVYPYRRIQEHKSQGDLCALCGQLAAEHRPDRARMKKEREGK